MSATMNDLLDLMQRLRDPQHGCPWDRAQTLQSLLKHTLEEAYEVVDVIERDALSELPNELGDLLFQVVFYAQIAAEGGHFDFAQVVSSIHGKLRQRHPHVFGATATASAAALNAAWETHKAVERSARGGPNPSELDDVPLALPALTRAVKLQKRASRVGFDWTAVGPIFEKIDEELQELKAALAGQLPPSEVAAELGDVLFAVANLARHLEIDPETAARSTNTKFERRFRYIEGALAAQGRKVADSNLAELDAWWERAKAARL